MHIKKVSVILERTSKKIETTRNKIRQQDPKTYRKDGRVWVLMVPAVMLPGGVAEGTPHLFWG